MNTRTRLVDCIIILFSRQSIDNFVRTEVKSAEKKTDSLSGASPVKGHVNAMLRDRDSIRNYSFPVTLAALEIFSLISAFTEAPIYTCRNCK